MWNGPDVSMPSFAASIEPMREPFRILVVCTANVCRSPTAAHFIAAAAADAGVAAEIGSSGFLFDGNPASAEVLTVMAERDADLSGHRSRITTEEMVGGADLVVAMERRHARDLTLLAPGASRRIHTLGGVVEALERLSPTGEPGSRLALITEGRLATDLLGEGDDEVADPYGRSRRVNRQTADRLDDLSRRLISGLFLEPSS